MLLCEPQRNPAILINSIWFDISVAEQQSLSDTFGIAGGS